MTQVPELPFSGQQLRDCLEALSERRQWDYTDLGPIGDGLIFVISNRGETATISGNYDETMPLSFSGTVTKVSACTHTSNTGTSSTQLNAYKRTAAGVKISLLASDVTMASGVAAATGTLSAAAGALSLAAGDRLGVDLNAVGTGASGIRLFIEFTRPAT